MNIHDLREAQLYFEKQMPTVQAARQPLHNLRQQFVSYYTPRRIKSMTVEHYALGHSLPEHGYNFCHTIERALGKIGLILGATSFKFGIYYGKTKSDPEYKYRFTSKFGRTRQEAFDNIKQAIVDLVNAGANEDIQAIIDNPISPMFKGKILSTYYPDRYLNVFSDEHLEHFLVQLNLDTKELIWSDSVLKREALLAFKEGDDVMKHWSVDIFSYFLYNIYPGRPPKPKAGTDPLKDYRPPKFPVDPDPSFVDLVIQPPVAQPGTSRTSNTANSNPDYDEEARKRKRLGDRGEKIVLEMERDRLRNAGFPTLARKVRKAKYDSDGYDILSFETDGTERFIEVKATKANVGQANFFLSINELNKAKELSNYYVYMVYEILKQAPKVWVIPNPFHPENKNVILTSISYRVQINATAHD